jgi:hypothetical protein
MTSKNSHKELSQCIYNLDEIHLKNVINEVIIEDIYIVMQEVQNIYTEFRKIYYNILL